MKVLDVGAALSALAERGRPVFFSSGRRTMVAVNCKSYQKVGTCLLPSRNEKGRQQTFACAAHPGYLGGGFCKDIHPVHADYPYGLITCRYREPPRLLVTLLYHGLAWSGMALMPLPAFASSERRCRLH